MLRTHNQAIVVTYLFMSFSKTFRSRRGGSVEHLTHPYSSFLPLYLCPPILYFLDLHLKLLCTSSQQQAYEQTASHLSLPSGVPCFPMTCVCGKNEEADTFSTNSE